MVTGSGTRLIAAVWVQIMRRSALGVAILVLGLLALSRCFVSPIEKGLDSPKLRAAVLSTLPAALPAPALATDQYTDTFSKVDVVCILVPIAFWITAFLEWESKQPSADDVTGYGYLGKTVDGPTEDKPAYFRRSPENG